MQKDVEDDRVKMQGENVSCSFLLAVFLQRKKRVKPVGRCGEYFVRVNVEEHRVRGQDDEVCR
jgi:hypothetical protein